MQSTRGQANSIESADSPSIAAFSSERADLNAIVGEHPPARHARLPSKKLGLSSSEPHPPSSERHPWRAKLRPPSSELEIFEQNVPIAEFEPPRVDHKARRASLQAPMTEQKASWCCCKKQHAQSKKPRGWRLERGARGLKGRKRGLKCRGRGSGQQRRLSASLIAT